MLLSRAMPSCCSQMDGSVNCSASIVVRIGPAGQTRWARGFSWHRRDQVRAKPSEGRLRSEVLLKSREAHGVTTEVKAKGWACQSYPMPIESRHVLAQVLPGLGSQPEGRKEGGRGSSEFEAPGAAQRGGLLPRRTYTKQKLGSRRPAAAHARARLPIRTCQG